MSKTQKFNKDELIVIRGAAANAAYLVLSGKVRVYLEKNGRIVTLAELEIGSLFGESALFEDNSEYGANVKALETTEVAVLTREDFKQKLQSCDPMIQSIIKTLIERQRHTNETLLEREAQEYIELDMVDAGGE